MCVGTVEKPLAALCLPTEWWSEQESSIWERCTETQPMIKPCRRTVVETCFPSRLLSFPSISPLPHSTLYFKKNKIIKSACHRARKGKKKKGINISRPLIVQWKRQHSERSRETEVAGGGKDRKSPSHLPCAEEEWVILRSATMLNDFSSASRSEGQLR